MRLNFADMLVYRLFHWWWNPILARSPERRELFISWLKSYDVLDDGDRVRVTIERST